MCLPESWLLQEIREEHEEEILLHQAAKNAFDEMGVKKLPKVKDLQAEYAKLLEEKKKTYASTGVPVRKCGNF